MPHSADMVFTNPPYIKNNGGILSGRDYKNIARREVMCTIDDVLCASARLVKNGGDFYCVYRPDRLQSLFAAMAKYNITPKKAVFIYAGQQKKASLVLIKGRQNANEGIAVENLFL
jgi:tRNA1(Val) A37 N6-methylase TrmN6